MEYKIDKEFIKDISLLNFKVIPDTNGNIKIGDNQSATYNMGINRLLLFINAHVSNMEIVLISSSDYIPHIIYQADTGVKITHTGRNLTIDASSTACRGYLIELGLATG